MQWYVIKTDEIGITRQKSWSFQHFIVDSLFYILKIEIYRKKSLKYKNKKTV